MRTRWLRSLLSAIRSDDADEAVRRAAMALGAAATTEALVKRALG